MMWQNSKVEQDEPFYYMVSSELGRLVMFPVVAWRRHTRRSLISEKTGDCDWAQITLKLIACKNWQGKS